MSVWSSAFSNANGWSSSDSYWETIQFPDVNGDGKADVCGRGIGGISCALSNGSGFGSVALWQLAFSDANLWDGTSFSLSESDTGPNGVWNYQDTIEYMNLDRGTCSFAARGTLPRRRVTRGVSFWQ